MKLKSNIAIIIVTAIFFNSLSFTVLANSRNSNYSSNAPKTSKTDIPIEEWYLPGESSVSNEFYQAVKDIFSDKSVDQITDSDISGYTGELILSELPDLTGLPPVVNRFTNISNLEILNTSITDSKIPDDLFSSEMPNLQQVVIKNDDENHSLDITSLPDDTFSNVPVLKVLSIYNTKLKTLPQNILKIHNSSGIDIIDVSYNELEELSQDFFKNIDIITNYISISNNNITTLPDGFLSNLTTSESIDISENQIIKLPSDYLANYTSGGDRIEYGNLFVPIYNTVSDNYYYKLQPSSDYSKFEYNVQLGSPVTSSMIISYIGKSPFVHSLDSSIRKELYSGNSLIFIPSLESKSLFDSNGNAITAGKAYGKIAVANADASQSHLYSEKSISINIESVNANNSFLTALSISDGVLTPYFDKDTIAYDLYLIDSVSSIDITAIPENSNSTVSGDIGTISIDFNTSTSLTINVTSENGRSTTSYVINLIFVSETATGDDYLTDIQFGNGINLTSFDPNVLEYDLSVDNDKRFIELEGVAADPDAVVISSATGKKTALNVGQNVFYIKVLSPNLQSSRTYSIFIDRQATSYTAQSASLIDLQISGQTLYPNFSANTYHYTVNVLNNVSSITISATAGNNDTIENAADLTNVSLNLGSNVIPIRVRNSDGTFREYTIDIFRGYLSNNANLTDLTITHPSKNIVITQAFDPNLLEYTVETTIDETFFENGEAPRIEAVAESSVSYIYGAGELSSIFKPESQVSVPVTVVSQDGLTTKQYVFKINFDSSYTDNDASLLDIFIPNSDLIWDTEFIPGTNTYNIIAPYYVNTLNIVTIPLLFSSTITGDIGLQNINVGKNTLVINVESGNELLSYTLNIVRQSKNDIYSPNSQLSLLSVQNQTITPNFNPSINSYTLSVTNDIDTIYLDAASKDYDATISINEPNSGSPYNKSLSQANEISLSVGNNNIMIVVNSADSINSSTYSLNIIRSQDVPSQLELASLKIISKSDSNIEYALVPGFDPKITSYTVNILSSEDSEVTIEAIPSDATSVVSGDGDQILQTGENTFVVSVEDTAGDVLDYTIIINKEKSSENRLLSLIINDGTNDLVLDPAFDKDIFIYDAGTVESDITQVTINPTPLHPNAVVTGDINAVNLKAGLNTLYITVTAEDGATKEYTVTITKKASSNADLKLLELSENGNSIAITPNFDPSVLKYTVNLAAGISEIVINFETLDPNAIVSNISDGDTIFIDEPVKLIDVVVLAEDGSTSKTYSIEVTKPSSNNSLLASIIIASSSGNIALAPNFDPNTLEYTASVNKNVTDIEVIASAEDNNATVTGDIGNIVLSSGDNILTITVTAEDGVTTKDYKVNVTRPVSDIATLSDLKILDENDNEIPFSPVFNANVTQYLVSVEYNISKIKINPVVTTSGATVAGDGEHDLKTGTNTITVTVTAEDGVATKNYTVVVERSRSNNDLLGTLEILNGSTPIALNETFDPNVFNYSATVDNSVIEVDVRATAQDSNATLTGDTGKNTLTIGDNTINIKVVAENGIDESVYKIVIHKKTSADATLKSLAVQVNGVSQPLNPGFDPSVDSYTVTVPKNIDAVFITASTTDPSSFFSGDAGDQSLNLGANTFVITVTAPDRVTTKEYTVTVNREASKDASLNSLKVLIDGTEQTLVPGFAPGTYAYTLTVLTSNTSVTIEAVASDSFANVTGDIGSKDIPAGTTTFTITVTAEDGVTTQNYTIDITRAASTDSTLASLTITDSTSSVVYTTDPPFSSSETQYVLDVPTSCDNVNISALANSTFAKVTGNTGNNISIAFGENKFKVQVTAEDGSSTVYNINIRKFAPDNADLTNLEISSGGTNLPLKPNFNKDITEYTLTVPYNTDIINITPTPADASSTVAGGGSKNLIVGDNTFEITVTAPRGLIKKYKVIITRAQSNDATLSALTVDINGANTPLDPVFSSVVTNYNLNVNSNIDRLTFAATPNIAAATITGDIGEKSLSYGDNNFTITITAPNGTDVMNYYIIVNRAYSLDATLNDLSVNVNGVSKPLTPTFNPNTNSYLLTVDNSVDNVTINATSNHSSATITGQTGSQPLVVGVNNFAVTVTASDGVTKNVYNIEITRLRSSNNKLSSLVVKSAGNIKDLTPAFSPDVTAYTLDVSSENLVIEISATAESASATIDPSSLGSKTLTAGPNHFSISVTAEDGTIKVYSITINRPASSISSLSNLEVKNNGVSLPLIPGFNSANLMYSLTVDGNISVVEIVASLNSSRSTISGDIGMQGLIVGANTFDITVTAEDGVSTTKYTVEITRPPSNDSTLSSISINSVTKRIITLSPSFDSNITSYSANIGNSIDKVDLQAVTSNPNAVIDPNSLGIKNLSVGDNVLPILVTAEDGSTKTYDVTISRSVPVNDIIIDNLPDDGSNFITISVGQNMKLNITFDPVGSYDDLIFTSSDERIAKVDEFGNIIAFSAGKVSITVSNLSNTIKKTFEIDIQPLIVPDQPSNPDQPGDQPIEDNTTTNTPSSNPQTSENMLITIVIFILSLATVALVIFRKRQLIESDLNSDN